MAKFHRKQSGEPIAKPEGEIRLGQIITTFGPGAMVDLRDEAVLVTGLDFWEYGKHAPVRRVPDERLRDYIVRNYRIDLAPDDPFRSPPIGEREDPSVWNGVPALEFPRWFVCQQCSALVRAGDGLERKKSGTREHHCADRKKPGRCVPVRFVGACRRGHLSDFPWRWFVHVEHPDCPGGTLYLHEGKTGDFAQIEIRCGGCGDKRRLTDAMLSELRPRCDGHRPWLGRDAQERDCTEQLHLLVRTASNGYFPQVLSALEIPDPESKLQQGVLSIWSALENATDAEDLAYLRKKQPRLIEPVKDFEDEEILATVARIRAGKELERPPLRTAEYQRFESAAWELKPEEQEHGFVAQQVAPPKGFGGRVARVVLAHKLREVRAQIGFTRLEPATQDAQGDFDLEVELSPLTVDRKWLPASEVWGEGVFIQLDEARVREWEERPAVKARADALFAGHKAWVEKQRKVHPRKDGEKKQDPAFLTVRFYLLHTLSHMLVSAIALDCGYAASAIRERIYCGPSEHDDTPMAAILLSTGTSGSEGTLGGLVDQGRRLEHHLARAIRDNVLCSNDPVCARHEPADRRAERFLEGAACHGCLFIAECSCERFNRYLDRALVVPTMGHEAGLAFFDVTV